MISSCVPHINIILNRIIIMKINSPLVNHRTKTTTTLRYRRRSLFCRSLLLYVPGVVSVHLNSRRSLTVFKNYISFLYLWNNIQGGNFMYTCVRNTDSFIRRKERKKMYCYALFCYKVTQSQSVCASMHYKSTLY